MGANSVSQKQVKEGIDAVIVDSVLAIRKGLTGVQRQQEKESNEGENGKDDGKVSNGNPVNGNGGTGELAIRANEG